MISRAIRHASAATKEGKADLCLYQFQLLHLQMHVHTDSKDFLVHSYKYCNELV